MKLLIIFFLFFVIFSRTNAQNFGKCHPTEEFKINFTKCTTDAFGDLNADEVKQLSEKDKEERFANGMWTLLKQMEVMNEQNEMLECGWVDRITEIVIVDNTTAEKLRIGIHACFVDYDKTIEASIKIWLCITNIKDVICEVSNPQICTLEKSQQQQREEILKNSIPKPSEVKISETDHADVEKKLKEEADLNPVYNENKPLPLPAPAQPKKPHSKVQCELPTNVQENAFKCLLQTSASQNGVDANSTRAFFNSIITNATTKVKLLEDSDSCSTKNEVNSDEHYQCLFNAYKKNCHAHPSKMIGNGRLHGNKRTDNNGHVSTIKHDQVNIIKNKQKNIISNKQKNIIEKKKKLKNKTNRRKQLKKNQKKTKKQKVNRGKLKSNVVKKSQIKNKKH